MNSTESTPTPETKSGRCCHGGGRKKMFAIPFFIAAFVLLKSAVAMLLWNELVPDLFHGPSITFLQSIELVVLAKVLIGFGGHGRGPMMGKMMRHRMGHKFAHMSPEEREKLRNELHKGC